jgi:hypothetical protein
VPTPVRPAADACRRPGIPARVDGNPVPMIFSLLLIFGVVPTTRQASYDPQVKP